MCIPQSKLDHGDLFTNKHVTGHHLVKYMLIHADNFTHTAKSTCWCWKWWLTTDLEDLEVLPIFRLASWQPIVHCQPCSVLVMRYIYNYIYICRSCTSFLVNCPTYLEDQPLPGEFFVGISLPWLLAPLMRQETVTASPRPFSRPQEDMKGRYPRGFLQSCCFFSSKNE